MFDLVPIVALIMVFGPFFYVVKRRYDYKEKQLTGQGPETVKLLKAHEDERARLIERIENLEAIVCNNDYELNLRIAQLAGAQSQPALGPGDDADAPAGATLTAGPADMQEKAAAVRAVVAAPAELAVGHVLASRYRIDRLLGRGGMGAVYLANDEVLGEHVALKIISAGWYHDPRALIERFRREAAAARKVSSPNVIRIHDLGEASGGLLYLSMEYFAGKTLAEIVRTRGPLGKHDLRDIIGQICDGIEAAHQAGVVHRDLKPQNVLVGERNAVKIIDFGLAKTGFMSGLTATGLLLGTPHYMSPEQVRGKDVDARSDIYALGALTYFAVTGQPPFAGDNPIAVSFAHLSETPARPRTHSPKLSEELDQMIMDALAKDPRDRPQSAAAFRQAL